MLFEETHRIIEDELAAVEIEIHGQLKRACDGDPLLETLFKSWSGKRGKRLRPRLTILSGCALRQSDLSEPGDGPSKRSLLTLAAIVELVHTASLIHDDVLDRSNTRRGRPTLNALFGNKTAILAGDVLYSQVFEMLLGSVSSENSHALIQCVRSMCRAELSSLSYQDCSAYEAIIEGKTASLMQYCCKAGAETARRPDSPADVIQALESFGHSFGMVYQLVDDLCDDDINDAAAPRDWLITQTNVYANRAETALTVIPDSDYKAGLAAMLEYVLSELGKATGKHTSTAATENASTVTQIEDNEYEEACQTCLS
jgi:geranylgeranyl pyrophosphate synthase